MKIDAIGRRYTIPPGRKVAPEPDRCTGCQKELTDTNRIGMNCYICRKVYEDYKKKVLKSLLKPIKKRREVLVSSSQIAI